LKSWKFDETLTKSWQKNFRKVWTFCDGIFCVLSNGALQNPISATVLV